MSGPVFVDTNVLLYARDSSEPAKQRLAADWLTWLWRERIGRTSTQVLSEYYVNATRKLKPGLAPADAWNDVKALLAWRPHPIDAATLRQARDIQRDFQLSWWDSLVVATAQLQGCTMLLTEDLQEGAVIGGVSIRSPFTHAANQPAATSAAQWQHATQAVPQASHRAQERHRGRGRPRLRTEPKPLGGGDDVLRGANPAPQKLRMSQSRVEAICRQFGVARLSVYGSASRNELGPESDVNLLVDFTRGSKEAQYDVAAMEQQLAAALGGRKVSIATPEIFAQPERRDSIMADLKLLFEA